MSKFLYITFIVTCFLTSQSFEIQAQPKTDKNILILFSLSPTTPAYRPMLEGIRQKISDKYGASINLHIEYLETENYPKGHYPNERFELLNIKYDDLKLDLLICIGINIIPIIKENGNSILLNSPTISLDVDFSKYGSHIDMLLNNQTTEIRLKLDFEKSISEVLRLVPDTKNIYFISGSSRVDSLFLGAVLIEAKKFENRIKPIFILNCSMDDVIEKIKHLPEKSVIIPVSISSDSRGIRYYNPEAVRLISKIANAPVFTLTDMGFENGAVGGTFLSFGKAGLIAGEVSVRILNGENPSSIKISENECYQNLFDWRELKRWNISKSILPDRSTVMYEETNLFLKYLWVIVTVSVIMFLQALIIVRLIKMNNKQKELNKKIIETENQYRQLYREDRILRLGKLTASLSHELNQPLTAILSMAQAGIRFIDTNNADPELIKEIFQNIVDDDKRAASILGVVRGMMKHEKREKDKVNLNKIIKEVVELSRSRSIELNSNIFMELANHPVYIMADAIQIQQVILNLISNAQQSVKKNSNLEKRIIVTEILENGYVTFSVRDYGRGIDETIKDTLFKPFVTSRKEGLGMGLAICRSIIEEHEGKIWAENMPEGGAQFSFKIKIYED